MKHLLLTAALLAPLPAIAGGPVIVEEPALPEVRPQGDGGSWIVPVIVGAIVLCAIACGSDGGPDIAPPKGCNDDGGAGC